MSSFIKFQYRYVHRILYYATSQQNDLFVMNYDNYITTYFLLLFAINVLIFCYTNHKHITDYYFWEPEVHVGEC